MGRVDRIDAENSVCVTVQEEDDRWDRSNEQIEEEEDDPCVRSIE